MTYLNQLLKPLRITLTKNQPVVCLDEEFGFRQWIWIPNVSSQKLESWWKRQHNLDLFYFLPREIEMGTWIQAIGEYNETLDISYNEVTYNLYHKLIKSGLVYTGHLFDNTDSFLISPKGISIYHMGRNPARDVIRKELAEQGFDYDRKRK